MNVCSLQKPNNINLYIKINLRTSSTKKKIGYFRVFLFCELVWSFLPCYTCFYWELNCISIKFFEEKKSNNLRGIWQFCRNYLCWLIWKIVQNCTKLYKKCCKHACKNPAWSHSNNMPLISPISSYLSEFIFLNVWILFLFHFYIQFTSNFTQFTPFKPSKIIERFFRKNLEQVSFNFPTYPANPCSI